MKKKWYMFICSVLFIFILSACSANIKGPASSEVDVGRDPNESIYGSNEESMSETITTEIISQSEETLSEMEKEQQSFQPEEQLSPLPEAKPSPQPDSEIPTESTESYVRIPYEVESITESYYEKNGSYIEFNDLPENDAETIACLRLLYSITGKSWTECGYEYYYVPEESSECREEIEEESWESICEWIKVEQVETMSLDSLAECDPRQELFAILKRQLYAGGTYEDYVQMLLDNGCVVVCVEYTDQYKAGYETVQVGDGAHETHWLFVPDENGQLRVFDYTGIFGQFNMSPGAKVPEVLKWSVK